MALIYSMLFTVGALILSPWLWSIALPAWAIVALDVVRELWLILAGRLRITCRVR